MAHPGQHYGERKFPMHEGIKKPPTDIIITLEIHEGYLTFVSDTVEDENLRSWVENMSPEDLISGTVRIEVPARASWPHGPSDGPVLLIGDEK